MILSVKQIVLQLNRYGLVVVILLISRYELTPSTKVELFWLCETIFDYLYYLFSVGSAPHNINNAVSSHNL